MVSILKKLLGIGALIGSSFLPTSAHAQVKTLPDGSRVAVDRIQDVYEEGGRVRGIEQNTIRDCYDYNGLEIRTDGELDVFRHAGHPIMTQTTPYISIGENKPCYQITMSISPGRKVSLKIPGKNRCGGIETGGNDILFTAKDFATINIRDRSNLNLVPLVTTEGFFEIQSGKYLNVHYDDPRGGIVSDDCGDMDTRTPAFQLFPFDTQKHMLKEGQAIFVDNFGKSYGTVLLLTDEPGRGLVNNYLMQTDVDDFERYFPTKAFAQLTPREKIRFWDHTTPQQQLELRGASLDVLKRYCR